MENLFSGDRSSVGRVQDCDSCCRGFEPHRSPHFTASLAGYLNSSITKTKQISFHVRQLHLEADYVLCQAINAIGSKKLALCISSGI
jgi:hypothetical protein